MAGTVTFIFDDGHRSALTKAYPIFKRYRRSACIAVCADWQQNEISRQEALFLQHEGWEVMSHSCGHIRLDDQISPQEAKREIAESRTKLEADGFLIRQFVTPMSQCAQRWQPLLQQNYQAAYSVYRNASVEPPQRLVIQKPVRPYELWRAGLSGKSLAELQQMLDYVRLHDAWIVFYDHDISAGSNVNEEKLTGLLEYIERNEICVQTGSTALAAQRCLTRRIRSGYDGKECYVHARMTEDDRARVFLFSQVLRVDGMDTFGNIAFAVADRIDAAFCPLKNLGVFQRPRGDGVQTIGLDFTPIFHPQSGKILLIGQTADYTMDAAAQLLPDWQRHLSYIVFNPQKQKSGNMQFVHLPDELRGFGCGSGQSVICNNGELLIPLNGKGRGEARFSSCVVRCRFQQNTLIYCTHGNFLSNSEETRGLYEPSVVFFHGIYYATLRADLHGYYSRSENGLYFEKAELWRWDDYTILENYNTQQHFFVCGDRLYLVYTRRAGSNNHVFRHRAPLFAAEVDTEKMCLIKRSEFIVVPERGARLGNFGAGALRDGRAAISAAEWMQPKGCEAYGSDNSIFVTVIR